MTQKSLNDMTPEELLDLAEQIPGGRSAIDKKIQEHLEAEKKESKPKYRFNFWELEKFCGPGKFEPEKTVEKWLNASHDEGYMIWEFTVREGKIYIFMAQPSKGRRKLTRKITSDSPVKQKAIEVIQLADQLGKVDELAEHLLEWAEKIIKV